MLAHAGRLNECTVERQAAGSVNSALIKTNQYV